MRHVNRILQKVWHSKLMTSRKKEPSILMLNRENRNFRMMGPDETSSNRLDALFGVTDRAWMAETISEDGNHSPEGRVMEILSEHTCQGLA